MALLAQLLVNAQAPAKEVRNTAIEELMKQRKDNSAQFLLDLARELSTESSPQVARQLSGLLLKNTLQNSTLDPALQGLWARLALAEKAQIRQHCLGSLAASVATVRRSAAQAVAAIAVLDLPSREWPDLLPVLVANATGENADYRVASIITLGYLLEGLEPGQLLKTEGDEILSALAKNILEAQGAEVKLEALKTLTHTLPFAAQNFKNEAERGLLMRLVLTSCQDATEDIRSTAFQALCEVALQYYDYIATHLPELWSVTSAAARSSDKKVASLAMEFWNIVADTERERKENPHPLRSMRNFIYTATSSLLPLLFDGILQAEEDSDEWTTYKSSGALLLSTAQLSGDPIVEPCLTFISSCLTSTDWRRRNAAMVVIGSVLEGPSPAKLAPIVNDGYRAVAMLLKDAVLQVRVTSAWTLSRICEFHFQQVLVHPEASTLLSVIVQALADEPKVAAHACTVAVHIAGKANFSSVFSPESFELLFTSLMQTAYRKTDADSTLLTAALTAVEKLIADSDAGFALLIERKLEPLASLLRESAQKNETEQNLLCSVLAACVRKTRPSNISAPLLQSIVDTLIALSRVRNSAFEEGIHLFGALALTVHAAIAPHVAAYGPLLASAVGKTDDSALCKAGTMVIGDIARALDAQIAGSVGQLVPLLVANLQSAEVSTDVKIQTIQSLGDLAEAAKGAFLPLIQVVMPFIETAADSSLRIVKDDPDLFSYLLELRESIVLFYTSLLHGLSEAQQADVLLQYMQKVVQYTFLTTQEQYKPTSSVHANALGLIGDIAVAYGAKAKAIVSNPVILNYVRWQVTMTNSKTNELARWTLSQIGTLNSF